MDDVQPLYVLRISGPIGNYSWSHGAHRSGDPTTHSCRSRARVMPELQWSDSGTKRQMINLQYIYAQLRGLLVSNCMKTSACEI